MYFSFLMLVHCAVWTWSHSTSTLTCPSWYQGLSGATSPPFSIEWVSSVSEMSLHFNTNYLLNILSCETNSRTLELAGQSVCWSIEFPFNLVTQVYIIISKDIFLVPDYWRAPLHVPLSGPWTYSRYRHWSTLSWRFRVIIIEIIIWQFLDN